MVAPAETPGTRTVGGSPPGQPRRNGVRHASGGRYAQESRSPAGRWSAAHWKTATFGWLLFVVAAVAAGTIAGTEQLTDAESSNGETARAERILAHAGFDKSATEAVLIQAKRGAGRPAGVADDVATMLRARR